MRLVPRESVCWRAADKRRAETEWVVISARCQSSGAVRHFTDAPETIPRVEECLRATPEPVTKVIDGVTSADSLFTAVASAPDHVRVGLHGARFLFHDAYPPLPSVVRKFTSMGPDVYRDELIASIPLERAGAVAGEIAIRVIRERLAGTRLVHLVRRRAQIAAPIPRGHDDCRRPLR